MSEKKKFLLRLDESLYAAVETWAGNDLRSVNAQIEYPLTDALRKAGRLKARSYNSKSEKNSGPPSSAS